VWNLDGLRPLGGERQDRGPGVAFLHFIDGGGDCKSLRAEAGRTDQAINRAQEILFCTFISFTHSPLMFVGGL
jgi:hypothetical protein